jgi:type II secretory pathway predicted ATPase ExeA
MVFRAHHVITQAGIRLAAFVAAGGYSRTTWSRFLRDELDPEPAGGRQTVERVLREHNVSIPADLWRRVNDSPAGAEAAADIEEGEAFMQMQSLSLAAQRAWELFMNPFDPAAMQKPDGGDRLDELHLSMDARFIETRMQQVITHQGFFALSGPAGSGKSTLLERAVRAASERYTVTMVRPANIERRKMSAVHIAAEIIRQLSGEKLPRTANERDAVAAQVLRHRYAVGERVCLVIDEAHELPTSTVLDLKRFWELRDGFAKLLGIILIGREELAVRFHDAANFRLREVIIRCELKIMKPMRGETGAYLARRFEWVGRQLHEVWEPTAVEALETRLAVKDQQLPQIINNAAVAAMNVAARRGNARVTADDVEAVWLTDSATLQELGF